MTNNRDYQFRLLRKNVKWVNKVHEVPENVNTERNISLWDNFDIVHDKTLERQDEQNKKYAEIQTNKKPLIKKIMYDSVLFSKEGITKHAREEIRELSKRGYNLQYINEHPHSIDKENEFLLDINDRWNVDDNDYVTIVNQPPVRWERTYRFKKLIGYLAFEGRLISEWVDKINKSPMLEVWTPTTYCKKHFIDSGVTKPVYVIPHGINSDIWKPSESSIQPHTEHFKFLWCGTPHNSRKGLDLALRAFNELFRDRDDVFLLIKANKVYNANQDVNKIVTKHCGDIKNVNVCTDDITEEEFVDLFNESHCYISPHRSEGFGMIILQSLACGIPTIATRATGNLDFCNDKNTLFIETNGTKWADWDYPYFDTEWDEPDIDSLKKQMEYVYANYKECKEKSLKESVKIRKQWTWKSTVDKIEKRINNI